MSGTGATDDTDENYEVIAKSKTQVMMERAASHQDIALIRLITKFTVLVSVSVITTILSSVLFGFYVPGVGLSIDGVINCICALYCFKYYSESYEKYCNCCHNIAFRMCACVIFHKMKEGKSDGTKNRKQSTVESINEHRAELKKAFEFSNGSGSSNIKTKNSEIDQTAPESIQIDGE